jgi:chorismate mutase
MTQYKKEAGSLTQCIGKIRITSLEKAERKVEHVKIKYGQVQRPYWCGICEGYHLTSKPLPNPNQP